MDSVRGGYSGFWVLGFFWYWWFFGNGIWLGLAWLGLDFVWKKGGDVLLFFSGYTIFVWRSVRGVVGDKLVGGGGPSWVV